MRQLARHLPISMKVFIHRCRNRSRWMAQYLRSGRSAQIRFICPICERSTSWARPCMVREAPSCGNCASTTRFRALVVTFLTEVMGSNALPSATVPKRDLCGLGFSDSSAYAQSFDRLTSYENSWFHTEPRRDLTVPDSFQGQQYDYVVCSEVLEHVNRPIERAFDTLFQILRPGGTLLLSVPTIDGPTVEHFPILTRHELRQDEQGTWVMSGTTATGDHFETTDLVFHGGPGTTLEFRAFGRRDLQAYLHAAGFVDVRERMEEISHYGIIYEGTPPVLATDGGLIHGMRAGIWVAKKPDGS